MTRPSPSQRQKSWLEEDLDRARKNAGQSLPSGMLLDLRHKKVQYFDAGDQYRSLWTDFHRAWKKEWFNSKSLQKKMILTLCRQFGDVRFVDETSLWMPSPDFTDWKGGRSFVEAWTTVSDRRSSRPVFELLGFHNRLQLGSRQQVAFGLDTEDVDDVSPSFDPDQRGHLRNGTGSEVLRSSQGDFVERANGRFPEQAGRIGPRSLAYMTHREAEPLFLSELCENRIQQSFFEREFLSDRIPSLRVEVRLLDELELHSWKGESPAIRELRQTYFRLLKRFALEENPEQWRMILVSGYESPFRSQSWDFSEQMVQWIAESEVTELIEEFGRIVDSPAWLMECPPTDRKARPPQDPDVLVELGIQPRVPIDDGRFFLGIDIERKTFSFRDDFGLSSHEVEEAVIEAVQSEVGGRL